MPWRGVNGNLRVRISGPGAARNRLATGGCPHVHWLRVLPSLGVDTDVDSSIEAILDRLSDERDLHDGVIAALLGHGEQEVLGICHVLLRVGVVWGCLLDLVEEVLLNVELTDVGYGSTLDGVVGQKGSTVVDDGYQCQHRTGYQRHSGTYCASGWYGQRSGQG